MRGKELIDKMREEKKHLCVGLDLKGETEGKITKAFEIIEQTKEFAVAYKPNRQFWLGLSLDQMIEINNQIHNYKCVSIIDHKLSDIGSSNEPAMTYSKKEGFDFMTISPFPGNMKNNFEFASKIDIGLINLVLMSNPEAEWMVKSKSYLQWAEQAEKWSDGIVVGTTNHVTKNEIQNIHQRCPSNFVLALGLGAQGGKVDDLLSVYHDQVLFSVSRGISNSENYYEAALKFHSIINEFSI